MPKSAFSVASTQSSDKMVKRPNLHDIAKNGSKGKPVDYNKIFEMPKPKKASTGYMFFMQERMNQFKVDDDQSGTKFECTKHSKQAAAEWAKLGDG